MSNLDDRIEKSKKTFWVTCPDHCETLLANELTTLGITQQNRSRGGIEFKGKNTDPIEVIMHSRVASRVFRELYRIRFRDEKELYRLANQIKWKAVLRPDQSFKIQSRLKATADKRRSKYRNSLYLSQILKDAIVDHFSDEFGSRPSIDKDDPDVALFIVVQPVENVHSRREEAIIYIDMAGTSLSHRGYRLRGGEAPLRENLAAALVLSSAWNPENESFTDSMCGSGTILIEALLIKLDLPPSYLKILAWKNGRKGQWAFEDLMCFYKDKYQQLKFEEKMKSLANEITKKLKKLPKTTNLYGFDEDAKALNTTRENLEEARLSGTLKLALADATTLMPPSTPPGIVICNPPYGERIGELKKLEKLYKNYGENLKSNWSGHRAFIFTAKSQLRKKIELKTTERLPFKNGPLDCRLLKYELY
jgi:23S rRNA G2445 N2-methylase RlmL